MRARYWLVSSITATLFFASVSVAQTGEEREVGPEFGVDLIYQLSTGIGFNGGSRLELDDDFGATLTFGYLFNPQVAALFAVDWNKINYHGTLQSASFPGLSADVRGDLEVVTPRVNALYYFLDEPLTPFATAGIGWSFIDTNIPTGQVQIGCWWDPWWGQICTPYQPTKDVNGFAWQVGVGGRWDFIETASLTLSYVHSWVDINNASGTPDVDQFRLGVIFRFY
jgi:opacity protein-like surface antigen